MTFPRLRTSILALSIVAAGCGGSGGGGGGGGTADPNADYDISAVLFGTPGVTRTIQATGPDAAGDSWTLTWSRTTLTATGAPCLAGETEINAATTLAENGITVSSATSESCYTQGTFIQGTFSAITSGPNVGEYSEITSAGNLNPSEQIGNSGLFGTWDRFDDNSTPGDSSDDFFIGTTTTNWSFEEQGGDAAFVLTIQQRDSGGALEFQETDTYFIDMSGNIQRFEAEVILQSGGTLDLSGGLI